MEFKLGKVVNVEVTRPNRLAQMYVLSAYVWREARVFRVAVRAVPKRDDKPDLKISEIWFGCSKDGVSFEMDHFPSIFPERDLNLDGCEDPTVIPTSDWLYVAYTGYNAKQETGRLLGAKGTGSDDFEYGGVLFDSVAPFINPKEAVFAPAGDQWKMLFEYADQDTNLSAIGVAVADHVAGPWRTVPDPLIEKREGQWDNGHMSPGIILCGNSDAPILFYNGGDETDGWRVGWAILNRDLTRVVDRCTEPLIVPSDLPGPDARDMAFVSSAVEHNGKLLLYYTVADRDLRMAEIEIVDDPKHRESDLD